MKSFLIHINFQKISVQDFFSNISFLLGQRWKESNSKFRIDFDIVKIFLYTFYIKKNLFNSKIDFLSYSNLSPLFKPLKQVIDPAVVFLFYLLILSTWKISKRTPTLSLNILLKLARSLREFN